MAKKLSERELQQHLDTVSNLSPLRSAPRLGKSSLSDSLAKNVGLQTGQSTMAARSRFGALDLTHVNIVQQGMYPQAMYQREEGMNKLPILTEWVLNPILGQPRPYNVAQMKLMAECSLARVCINTICDEIGAIEWDIMPADPDKEGSFDEKDIEKAKAFFNNPNKNDESFNHIIRKLIQDLKTHNTATLVKVYDTSVTYVEEDIKETEREGKVGNKNYKEGESITIKCNKLREGIKLKSEIRKSYWEQEGDEIKHKGFLREIYAADTSSFYVDMDLFGQIFGYYQYSWRYPAAAPIWFDKREIVWFNNYPRTRNFYGYPIIFNIMEVLETFNKSVMYNLNTFSRQAIPQGAIFIEDQIPDLEEAARQELEFQTKFMGKPNALAFIYGKAHFEKFLANSREMEWSKLQMQYLKIIASAFGLTPVELGFIEDASRATAEQQTGVNIRKNLMPLLKHLEYEINTQLIPDLELNKPSGIMFKFNPINIQEEQRKLDNIIRKISSNLMTVNEGRMELGLDPFTDEGADQPGFVRQQEQMEQNKLDSPKQEEFSAGQKEQKKEQAKERNYASKFIEEAKQKKTKKSILNLTDKYFSLNTFSFRKATDIRQFILKNYKDKDKKEFHDNLKEILEDA